MPFVLIKGRFRPDLGQPDGDSVRFAADDLTLWARLEGVHPRVSRQGATVGTVQLRFEGIDSVEKEALAALAAASRDNMVRRLDAGSAGSGRGHVLSRMTDDKSGRPIAFAFAGEPPEADGAEVYLDPARLTGSANWAQMRDGHAYPLYYNTLFAALRSGFDEALAVARRDRLGLWASDATGTGVTVRERADLATIPPIWPKLWRRLRDYLVPGRTLDGFVTWLEARNERIDILSAMEERGLQDVVEVAGDRVRLTVAPEDIRVVGEAGARPRRP